jgi:hypothetical protein
MFNENLSKDIKALAYEKSIDAERVYKALEDALSTAARKYYKTREPLETILDRSSGAMKINVIKEIVENEDQIEDPQAQWTLDQARKIDPKVEVGGTIKLDYITKEVVDVVKDPHTQIRTFEAQKIDKEVEQGDEVHIPLTKPPDELGRIAAQSAKQVLYQKVREAEREKVYNEFKDKMGELENGYVKRFERGDMIIDLNGKTEGIIPRHHQSRAERYSQGDRIKAVIVDVHTQPKGPQVVLSRTDPRLLIKLFEMEVPEVYDGPVVIDLPKDVQVAPGVVIGGRELRPGSRVGDVLQDRPVLGQDVAAVGAEGGDLAERVDGQEVAVVGGAAVGQIDLVERGRDVRVVQRDAGGEVGGVAGGLEDVLEQEAGDDLLENQRDEEEDQRAFDRRVRPVEGHRAAEQYGHHGAQHQHDAEAEQVQAEDELLAHGGHRRVTG